MAVPYDGGSLPSGPDSCGIRLDDLRDEDVLHPLCYQLHRGSVGHKEKAEKSDEERSECACHCRWALEDVGGEREVVVEKAKCLSS